MSLIRQYAKHLFIHRLFLNCTIILKFDGNLFGQPVKSLRVLFSLRTEIKRLESPHGQFLFVLNLKIQNWSTWVYTPPPPEVLLGLVLIDIKFSVWCFIDHCLSCCPPSFSPFYCLALRFTASHYPYGIFKHFLKIIFYFY